MNVCVILNIVVTVSCFFPADTEEEDKGKVHGVRAEQNVPVAEETIPRTSHKTRAHKDTGRGL